MKIGDLVKLVGCGLAFLKTSVIWTSSGAQNFLTAMGFDGGSWVGAVGSAHVAED